MATLDLVAFADAVAVTRKPLARQIIGLRDAHSAQTDLRLAHDFMRTLIGLRAAAQHGQAGSDDENCAMALLYSAIVLYARATKSSSRHRNTFNIEQSLDYKELQSHDIINGLRDDAIAHFGPGKNYSGPVWQKDGVFVVNDDQSDGKIVTLSRRLVVNPQLITLIDNQIHRALILSEKNTQKRNSSLTESINKLIQNDDTFLPEIQCFAADLADFVGTSEAAMHILEGPRTGHRRGSVSGHT